MIRRLGIFIAILVTGGQVACARPLRHRQALQFDTHAIFVDRLGLPHRVQPPGDGKRLDANLMQFEYGAQLSRMLDSLHTRSTDTVVVVVHGGLNSLAARPKATAAILEAMEQQGGYYPIVVNWNSGAFSTYLDQSVRVRSGQYVKAESWQKPIFGSLNVLSDLLVGVVDAPRVATHRAFELLHDRNMPSPPGDDVFVASAANIEIGRSAPYGWSSFGADLAAGLQLPLKLGTGVIIDAFGGRMWQNMSRRTRLTVRTTDDYCNVFRREPATQVNPCTGFIHESGAIAQLVDSLIALRSGARGLARPPAVILVAHSMGTMIANNILRMAATRGQADVPVFDEIVYMAAASSIRDLETSVVPYLRRYGNVQFSMLTLHPANESREVNFLGFIPRGSLLTWIDAGFERTRSFDDRTAGRIANLTSSLTVFPDEVRSRVSVKMFGERGPNVPRKHGDFLNPKLRFWEPEFRRIKSDARRPAITLPSKD